MGTLLRFLVGFGGTLIFLYWLYFYAPATNTPFAPSTSYTPRIHAPYSPSLNVLTKDNDSITMLYTTHADTLLPYPASPCASQQECNYLDSLRSEQVLSRLLAQVRAGRTEETWRQWMAKDTMMSIHDEGVASQYRTDTVNHRIYLRIKIYSFQGHRQYLYHAVDTGWRRDVYYANDSEVYLTDSLIDLNGDGHADYWIHYYPSAGSHPREVYQVYSYRPTTQHMEFVAELLNPTFYPEEGLIRGFGYGYIEEVDWWTYRWNSYQLDTVEIIEQPYGEHKDSLPIVRYYWENGMRKRAIIESVPSVYLRGEGVK